MITRKKLRVLMNEAKKLILEGDRCLKAAAEHIAKASEQGASQREIAKEIGKSQAWVCRLLAWRTADYAHETPFGPESKAKRERAADQAPDQPEAEAESDQDEVEPEAEAEADEDEAGDDDQAPDDDQAEQAREKMSEDFQEALDRARAKARRARGPGSLQAKRELLVKALGMLGSAHAGERASAALVVERLRTEIGLTWGELIIDDLDLNGFAEAA